MNIVSIANLTGDAVLPFLPDLARQCLSLGEQSTGDQLVHYYAVNVGYNPLEDDPSMSPQQLAALCVSHHYADLMGPGYELPQEVEVLIYAYFGVKHTSAA